MCNSVRTQFPWQWKKTISSAVSLKHQHNDFQMVQRLTSSSKSSFASEAFSKFVRFISQVCKWSELDLIWYLDGVIRLRWIKFWVTKIHYD